MKNNNVNDKTCAIHVVLVQQAYLWESKLSMTNILQAMLIWLPVYNC